MPTLRDVARHAGVSIGTASNAFNKPDACSDDSRRKVLAAAAALGYRGPDPAARRLRTGRSGAIGVVFTDSLRYAFDDVADAAFLRGVVEGLEDAGASLLIIPKSASRQDTTRVASQAIIDGAIVYSVSTTDPRLEAVSARELPAVVVDQPRSTGLPFVGIDDRGAARAAAAHLRALGHERVAVISFAQTTVDGAPMGTELTDERLAGYRDGLGAAWDPSRIVHRRPTASDDGREAVRALLGGEQPPTGILAMSDVLALGAIQAARDVGLTVPGDVSVVGFDDSQPFADPPLTTIRQPLQGKGREAARILLRALAGESPAAQTILPSRLMIRATTAPCKARADRSR